MIAPQDFIDALKTEGFASFTGVPCSFFQASITHVLDRPDLRYTIVPNEGSAMALAAGAWLAGERTAVFIQNSGFGNLINPLTSLNMIYGIPALVFMSGRAYGVKDEPQHEIIGNTMGAALDAFGVRHEDMPQELPAFKRSLASASAYMKEKRQPFFFLVRKDTLEEYTSQKAASAGLPMKRIDAIRVIAEMLGEECVVATTGKPSRELFSVFDRKKNFYMQGSMGHAASIGLGLAQSKPGEKVVILDGDGAALMHLGIFSTIGHERPANLYHIVLDNESYETTGDQDTTSRTTDFGAIALSCGYRRAQTVSDAASLRSSMDSILSKPGPALLRVKINRLPTEGIARISSKYDSAQIASNFKAAVAG